MLHAKNTDGKVMFMIRIFNEIAKRQENARLVIIGHGSMEDKMMSLVEELGIGDRVENLGRTEDIKQYYNAFDAFLLPSLYEGLPVVGVLVLDTQHGLYNFNMGADCNPLIAIERCLTELYQNSNDIF